MSPWQETFPHCHNNLQTSMLPATKFVFEARGFSSAQPKFSTFHKNHCTSFPWVRLCFLVSLFLSYILESSVPSSHEDSQITKLPIGSPALALVLGLHLLLGQPLWLFDCILRASEPEVFVQILFTRHPACQRGSTRKGFL